MKREEPEKLLPEEEKMGEIVLYSEIFRERVFQIILVWVKGALRKILFLPQEVLDQEMIAKEKELEAITIRATLEDLRKSLNAYAFLNFDERMRGVLAMAAASPLLRGEGKEVVEVLPGPGVLVRESVEKPFEIKELFQAAVKEYSGEDLRRLRPMVRHAVIDDEEASKIPGHLKPLFSCIIQALRESLEEEISSREKHSPLPRTGRQALRFLEEHPDFLEALSGIMQMAEKGEIPDTGRWKRRISSKNENPVLPANSSGEAILNQVYELLIPPKMTPWDLRDPDTKHCLWGRISGVSNQNQNILDFMERDKLSLLMEIDHEYIKPLRRIQIFLDWATLPESAKEDEEQRIDRLLCRVLVGFKQFQDEEYYDLPDGEVPEMIEKVSTDELWMMYYLLRDALETSESIDETLSILLPGVEHQFMKEADPNNQKAQFPANRFRLWSMNAGRYFEGVGEKNAMLLMESFFDGMASKSKREWELKRPEWKANPDDPNDEGKSFFEVIRDHAKKRARVEKVDVVEISREEEVKSRVRGPWKHLAHRTIRDMLMNPEKVEETSQVLSPLIDADRAIRILAHQHLVKLDPRLFSDGKIMTDTLEIPGGDVFCTLAVISGQLAVVAFDENTEKGL
jgi:hypothetical protein